MISDLNMSHEKFCDFVSVQLFGFFGDITDKFYFLNHWNTLTFFAKKGMSSDLNMFQEKMSEFVWFPLFGLTLVIKLKNFDFESQGNT